MRHVRPRHAALCEPHAGPDPRRARQRRPARRRPPARAQQLREPRLPGHASRTRLQSSPSSTAPDAGATRRSSRSTRSSRNSPSARFPRSRPRSIDGTDAASLRRLPLRRLSQARRPHAGARRPDDARMDRTLHRAPPRGRRASRPSPRVRRSTSRRFGDEPRAFLLAHDFMPADLRRGVSDGVARWRSRACATASTAPATSRRCACTATATPATCCGRADGPHFVDFDDARMGPAVQDLWMLLSGDRAAMTRQLSRRARGLRGLPRVRPRASCISSRRCARCA